MARVIFAGVGLGFWCLSQLAVAAAWSEAPAAGSERPPPGVVAEAEGVQAPDWQARLATLPVPAAGAIARQRGLATWYADKFKGRRTASGERYDASAMTAAHPNWPLSTYARVRHLATGRWVIVRINDRGPFAKGRIIDLSHAAARALGLMHHGTVRVEVERLWHKSDPALSLEALEMLRALESRPHAVADQPELLGAPGAAE